jgi:aconitate hydratase A / 2-methylisocitrate dehydratase
MTTNSFDTLAELDTGTGKARFHSLARLERAGFAQVGKLPRTIKVLLEAALRGEDGLAVREEDVVKLAQYNPVEPAKVEIPFKPARVLVQDFTGVPAVVDLAALRSAMQRLGGDPSRVNPQIPVDLVIDHSVQVDAFGSADALAKNAELEFERNRERYEFLHWGQQAFDNFSVVPPASGICHQVNLEYLARVVQLAEPDGVPLAYPDSLVGLDSHTTMIGGLGILGWGVGGIEAEAAMLGQPLYMVMPEVIGLRLTGALPAGTTATDLALVVTQLLRARGVVGKLIEFFGPGLSTVSLADRATIANMAPEYGATASYFPVDDEALHYLRRTGRPDDLLQLVERYSKEQGLFRADADEAPTFTEIIDLELGSVEPSLAGPRRPQDRITLQQMKPRFGEALRGTRKQGGFDVAQDQLERAVPLKGAGADTLHHGSVVVAAITSCTNTSNPSVMLAAGLLAKKAVERGLTVKPGVKTSLAPGSKVVTEYLNATGLLPYLEQLGFHVVGYGCTTCIGNSGPLPAAVAAAVAEGQLVVASVLSGNRNFEGRIHAKVLANYLASPPLVVAYALAGSVDVDLTSEPLGRDAAGKDVYLKDLWPAPEEINALLEQSTDPETFTRVYERILTENETWNAIQAAGGAIYPWDEESSYIQEPPFFVEMSPQAQPIAPIVGARVLVKVGDSVTTDHISPAGAIPSDSPAGTFLIGSGVEARAFNSYGSRRGNDRVMTRGTFANIRLRNQLADGREGGWTTYLPGGELTTIFAASRRYIEAAIPTIVLAGNDYGMGSSRDWAAKGTFLLGVRAVLARSFERIHRSNLVGMGVLPLQFGDDEGADQLGLSGLETYTIQIGDDLAPGQDVTVQVLDDAGNERSITARCRLDTPVEVEYYRNGGILHTVLRNMLDKG